MAFDVGDAECRILPGLGGETHRDGDVPALISAAQQADESAGAVWFLPYLSGERTPHNNPEAKGVFFGLTHQHGPAELARAVLEGVGYALADGMDVVHDCGLKPSGITLIGGGARSSYWRQMLSDISGLQLDYRTGGDVGPALGAARLAQIAVEPGTPLSQLYHSCRLNSVICLTRKTRTLRRTA
jgi:xylulokinase